MSLLTNIEVLPGLDLLLWLNEDHAAIAEQLSDLFSEIDAMPGLGWPPDDEPVSDPNWLRWLDEGGQVAGCMWLDDFADVTAMEDRDGWIGA